MDSSKLKLFVENNFEFDDKGGKLKNPCTAEIIVLKEGLFGMGKFRKLENNPFYFMLSGRISRNIGENIFRSNTSSTSENIDFHVLAYISRA